MDLNDNVVRVVQNGVNYRCVVCDIRSREIPTCEHCQPPKPKKKKAEPTPEPEAVED